MISHSLGKHRRVLVFAATFFFIASVYLCATRLFNMTYSREESPIYEKEKPKKTYHTGGRIRTKLIHADLPMSYGDYNRPGLDGLATLTGAIPKELVPTTKNGRRLIVIGDIHGMSVELNKLLDDTKFDEAKDHVVAAGDMISKGPDSPGVVSRLMEIKASAVRGNHEDRVLLAYDEAEARNGVAEKLDDEVMQDRKNEIGDLGTARNLTEEQRSWLSELPVILTADPLPITIVHAGLVPGVELEHQDPWAVMNMRTLVYPREENRKKEGEEPRRRRRRGEDESDKKEDGSNVFTKSENPGAEKDGEDETEEDDEDEFIIKDVEVSFDRQIAVPNDGRKGEKWADEWNDHQLRQPEDQRQTVIYGHDAKSGYKELKYSIGLDSGCVKGGALSALIVEAAEKGFKHTLMQVECQDAEPEDE